MPLYEYECAKGHHFEEIQKFADPPISQCPMCSSKAKRLLSKSNFALKGDGWHRDGYAKNIKNKSEKSESQKPFDDTNMKEVAKRTRETLIKREFGDQA